MSEQTPTLATEPRSTGGGADLHIVDGDLHEAAYPITPGHEIVGTVVAHGPGVEGFAEGERVGVPWLGWACGEARSVSAVLSARLNLCAGRSGR